MPLTLDQVRRTITDPTNWVNPEALMQLIEENKSKATRTKRAVTPSQESHRCNHPCSSTTRKMILPRA